MTSPFDPLDVTWSRVSPRLTAARLIPAAITFAVPGIAGAVLAVTISAWFWFLCSGAVVILVLTVLIVPRQVEALGYAEREDDLLIRKGILFRSLTVVPYGRMQYVDVEAGPLTRHAGIAQVQLHTASASSDAAIPGLPESEAARLRDRLSEAGEARLAGL